MGRKNSGVSAGGKTGKGFNPPQPGLMGETGVSGTTQVRVYHAPYGSELDHLVPDPQRQRGHSGDMDD